MSSFQIFGLPAEKFSHLADLSADELAGMGARRVRADSKPGYPCRVSLADAEVGEEVFLLSYAHLAVASPFRASGPIYVRVRAREHRLAPGEVPACVLTRLMSARAYDDRDFMVAAQVSDGEHVSALLAELFENSEVQYVQLHNAKPGCFSCEARRVAPERRGV